MAVATFFMLSGYLAVVKDETNTELWLYLKKRAIRLYPAYWVAVTVTFIVTYCLLPARSVSIIEALFNFTMLESFVGVSLVDGAYWTLANELIFYAFIAVVVVLLKKRKVLPIFCLSWVIVLFVYSLFESDSLAFAAIGKLIAKQYGHMFATGVSILFLTHDIGTRWIKIIAGVTVILSIVYQYLIFGWGYTLYFLISLLVISGCIVVNNKGLAQNQVFQKVMYPLKLLAAISYPLYLLHQNIGYAMLEHLRPVVSDREWIIIIPLFTVSIAAYLIYRFVEQPITEKFKSKA